MRTRKEICIAAGKASVKAQTATQILARVTAAGNATLHQYGAGYYAAMGRKSASLRKT